MNISKTIGNYENAAKNRQSFSKKTSVAMKLVFDSYLINLTNSEKLKKEIDFYKKRLKVRQLQKEILKGNYGISNFNNYLVLCLDSILEEHNYTFTVHKIDYSFKSANLTDFLREIEVKPNDIIQSIQSLNVDIVDFYKRKLFLDSHIMLFQEHGYKFKLSDVEYFKQHIPKFNYSRKIELEGNVFIQADNISLMDKIHKKIQFLVKIMPDLTVNEKIDIDNIQESFNKMKNIYEQYTQLGERIKKEKIEQDVFVSLNIYLDNIYNSYIMRLEKEFKIEINILEQHNKTLKIGK